TGNDTVTTAENSTFTFSAGDFPFNDPDGDTLQSVRVDTLPAGGTLKLSGNPISANQVIPVGQLGSLTYTPPANQVGSPFTTFTFDVYDGFVYSASPGTMTVNVTPVPPTTGNDTVTMAENSTFTFASGNFPFNDTDGDTLQNVRVDTLPASGTLKLSGNP